MGYFLMYHIGCEVSTKRDGADFRDIGCGHGLENTPWNALEDFTDQEGLRFCAKNGMKMNAIIIVRASIIV
jgi:hypothetical protein